MENVDPKVLVAGSIAGGMIGSSIFEGMKYTLRKYREVEKEKYKTLAETLGKYVEKAINEKYKALEERIGTLEKTRE